MAKVVMVIPLSNLSPPHKSLFLTTSPWHHASQPLSMNLIIWDNVRYVPGGLIPAIRGHNSTWLAAVRTSYCPIHLNDCCGQGCGRKGLKTLSGYLVRLTNVVRMKQASPARKEASTS